MKSHNAVAAARMTAVREKPRHCVPGMIPGMPYRGFCVAAGAALLVGLAALAAVAAEESLADRRRRIQEMTPAQQEARPARGTVPGHAGRRAAAGAPPARTVADRSRRRGTPRHDEPLLDLALVAAAVPARKLLDLEPAQRLKAIKQMMQEQAPAGGKHLAEKDRLVMIDWLDRAVTAHETQLVEFLPENRRRQFAKTPPAVRHKILVGMMCQRLQLGATPVVLPMTDKEVAALAQHLSPEARARLKAKPAAEQTKTLMAWLQQAARHELSLRREGGQFFGFDDRQLAEFFESQLTDEERDRLMSLPGEEMQQRLHELFLTRTKLSEPGGHRGDRPWHPRHGLPLFPNPPKDDTSKPPK